MTGKGIIRMKPYFNMSYPDICSDYRGLSGVFEMGTLRPWFQRAQSFERGIFFFGSGSGISHHLL
jgi:hypothetical protein